VNAGGIRQWAAIEVSVAHAQRGRCIPAHILGAGGGLVKGGQSAITHDYAIHAAAPLLVRPGC